MVSRVLLVLAAALGFFGVAWIVVSALFVRSVDNGISRHIVDGTGITRGATMLVIAVLLTLVALAARPAR